MFKYLKRIKISSLKKRIVSAQIRWEMLDSVQPDNLYILNEQIKAKQTFMALKQKLKDLESDNEQ